MLTRMWDRRTEELLSLSPQNKASEHPYLSVIKIAQAP